MLHTCQQAGQVIGVGGRRLASVVCQRRIDDRGLDGGGLDVDGLQFAGCGSPGSAGVIGGVGLIDGVELVLVIGYVTASPLADLHLTGRNAVCTDRNGGGVQQRVSRSALAVEVDMTGGDSGGPGSRIRDLRGQRDLLALELGEAGGDRGTGDGHRIFSISAGDFQRGGGGLKRRCSGRLRVQADVVLVFLQNAAGSVLRGLQIQTVMIFAERHNLCTELIAGLVAGDQIGGLVAGFAVRLPVVLADFGVLPDDLVVLAEHRLFAVQRFHAGDLVGLDLERVGLACDHGIGNWCAGCAVALVDNQLTCCCIANHPADRLREDADVHFIGLCTVGIAFISFGFEDSVVILVLRGGLVLANLHGEFRGLTVDGGRADLRTGCTGSCGLVELDRTLRTDIQRCLQSDGFTLILDDAACRGRIGNIRDRQRHICALGFPHGIQRGIRCEFSSSTRLDLVNRVVGIRSICLAVGVPTEEVVARADRGLVDDLVVDRRCGVQIVLYSLRLGHTGHVIARIRIINDRHGFALDADDGDIGVLLRGELEGVGLAVFTLALGGVQHVVDTDLHLRCVVAIENLDGEGHGGAVNHHVTACERARCRFVLLGAFHRNGVAGCGGDPSDLRGDGRQLGVEHGVAGNGSGEIPLVGISTTRVLIPAAEREALDLGVNGLGGLFIVTDPLCQIDITVGLERHGVGRVGGDINIDRNILRDVRQAIFIFLRSVDRIDIWPRIGPHLQPTIDAGGVLIDLRVILRVGGVNDQVKIEAAAVLHGHGAIARVERIPRAAAERDGVGVLLPHGVEGDIAIDLLREGRAGEVGRGGRGVALAPTEEGAAILGRDDLGQRGRQTVGLGDRSGSGDSGGPAAVLRIIRDRYLIGRVTAVQDEIACYGSGGVKL